MADQRNTNPVNAGRAEGAQPRSPDCGRLYQIHLKGQLDSRWSEWLEGLEVEYLENGEMTLWGPIEDQSALMGILNKLARLNLTLISINPIERKKNEYDPNQQP